MSKTPESDLSDLFKELESIAKETKPKENITNVQEKKEEVKNLFLELDSIVKESKSEEKKRKDHVETTPTELSSLFSELEKISQETKKLDEVDKQLDEFVNIFAESPKEEEVVVEEPADEEEQKLEPEEKEEEEKKYEEPPEDDPTDDVSDKGSLEGWIEKKEEVEEEETNELVEKSVGTLDDMRYQTEIKEETNPINALKKEIQNLKRKFAKELSRVEQKAWTGSGGGAGFVGDLADIEAGTVKVHGNYIKYDANSQMFVGDKGETEDLVLNGTDSESSNAGDRLILDGTDSESSNANSAIDLEDGSDGPAIDLSNVTQDILPLEDGKINIGSDTKRFKEIFLASETINLGGAEISSDGTGTVTISGDGAVLPAGSKVQSEVITTVRNKIAVASENGQGSVEVPFYSLAGGTTTPNKVFKFASMGNSYVFSESGTFTFRAGTSLESQNPEIFRF